MQYHTGKKRTFNFVHSQPFLHPHQNIDREAHHSPTWHGSESESALERFEPVAVVMLQSDGQGTLFALVAARRQGEIYKRRNASYMTFAALLVIQKRDKQKEL